ncbi:hypothetical protein PFISCL1PPCAC_13892 [Pristionchus fissidentatus]|uniref:Uncharacterized protein n=1 Tax=Pristionchus fissidentatus TaxID=1538716 RepID=A0AAV5VSW6_9BILA|nr:hypothetical protein PFISCL1PPCAC_13892 [Pristionchus fissidentatus]
MQTTVDSIAHNISKFTDLNKFPLLLGNVPLDSDRGRFIIPVVGREEDTVDMLKELRLSLTSRSTILVYKQYRQTLFHILAKVADESIHGKLNLCKAIKDQNGRTISRGLKHTSFLPHLIELYTMAAGVERRTEEVQILFTSAFQQEFNLAVARFRRNAQDRLKNSQSSSRNGRTARRTTPPGAWRSDSR